MPPGIPFVIRAGARASSETATSPRDEVKDEDDYSEHQQKMNQATRYVEAEAQKPQY
jgi:hypothetical protein